MVRNWLNRCLCICSLLLVLNPLFTMGQTTSYSDLYARKAFREQRNEVRRQLNEPQLIFTDLESGVRGDTLRLRFKVQVKGKIVGFDEALHLVPMYHIAGDIIALPEIQIQDEVRNRYYRREIELMSKEEYLLTRPLQVVIQDGNRTDEVVYYSHQQLLPHGLSSIGELKIHHFLQDCCDLYEIQVPNEVALLSQPIEALSSAPEVSDPLFLPFPTIYPRDLIFYRPAPEPVKEREAHASFRIQFVVDKHDIQPQFAQNHAELARVDQFLKPLLEAAPSDIELRGASIRGYASPEASFQHNLRLSQRRADSFKNYLQSRYHRLMALAHFPAIGMGEDWEGLREAIVESGSSVPMRDEVLAIIDFVDLFAGREKQLMDLGGGVPYRYLLNTLFPPLRRMEMEVGYKVRGYSRDEVSSVYDKRPQDLSHEEIFEVAQQRNRQGDSLKSFGLEYDLAVKYFPKDKIAYLNASSAALIRGDYELARTYLDMVRDEPEALLNLGVYYWAEHDYSKAVRYFELATKQPRQSELARRFLQLLQREAERAGVNIAEVERVGER